MRYRSIEELPFVCQYNLPEAAQQVYLDAFNDEWITSANELEARAQAFAAVREQFVKDEETGSWIAKSREPRRVQRRESSSQTDALTVLQPASA
jgi:cation transport regulator ChaB